MQIKRWSKFLCLILLADLFSHSTVASICIASDQGKIPGEKLSVEKAAQTGVAAENIHDRPSAPSPKKIPDPAKNLTPSKQESADIQTTDAPAGAKGNEEVAVEEDNGNHTEDPLDAALEFYQASQELWLQGELEEAIDALDEAYSLILQVKSDSAPAMIQQKEDLRILISRRLIEIYASRYTSINGNHKAIPLTMNERVEYEIKQFQTVERDFFINACKRSGRYIHKILKALNEAGLPEELAWLPLVESGFNVRALSPARALGLWQFIPSTGYKFGLKRDDWIDERLDPEKSTRAAIAYLQELHRMFGDWTTVLAAYNSGEENVLRVIRGQKVNYLDNFWDLYERLPRETARYVPRFLATLHIMREPGKYGFDLGEPEEPLACEGVTVEKQMELSAVAKELGIGEVLLCDLNPELRLKATPPISYSLRIPPAMSEVLSARLDRIPEWRFRTSYAKHNFKRSSNVSYVFHRVNEGECLSSIAQKYGTTVAAVSRANNIGNTGFIRTGQRLKIPLNRGRASK